MGAVLVARLFVDPVTWIDHDFGCPDSDIWPYSIKTLTYVDIEKIFASFQYVVQRCTGRR